jgi:hypothetical protein
MCRHAAPITLKGTPGDLICFPGSLPFRTGSGKTATVAKPQNHSKTYGSNFKRDSRIIYFSSPSLKSWPSRNILLENRSLRYSSSVIDFKMKIEMFQEDF